ncbi:cytochrome c maturation protein CcmE [Kyrpidia tusciae]|uniref:CcmE/CycJ protein n=1 Tax=Kyrpidia tusciae (strain DSM 2912 / NBRC 15312 / T2) TaxID=562970 RepID=D5WU52_KYRT2|nr:cytochrome c maturation protein CcmE [Kyrpidia tusciae]ADG07304.1 CcmE/CycJ protein [Kyrpidia tusciae DSM 2912]MBE3551960.1 cytochrome c maturation protein CcmE [Kyrpidia tusciae]
MSTRTKAVAALIVVLAVIGGLIWVGVTRAASYYLTVDEAAAKGQALIGRSLKVSGNIAPDSVQWNPDTLTLAFRIQGTDPSHTMPVLYHGVKPSDFSNGWPVVAEGKLGSDGVLHADQLLVKCPSKYEAQQPGQPGSPSSGSAGQQPAGSSAQ